MGITTFFLYMSFFITWVDSHISVTARVGSKAVLPCESMNASSQTCGVKWRTKAKVVFERLDKDIYEDVEYEGRVDVPEDELLKGNCALVLKHVTLTDANVYYSLVLKRKKKRTLGVLINSVELIVDDKPEERSGKKSSPSGNTLLKGPYTLIVFVSLLSWLLFELF